MHLAARMPRTESEVRKGGEAHTHEQRDQPLIDGIDETYTLEQRSEKEGVAHSERNREQEPEHWPPERRCLPMRFRIQDGEVTTHRCGALLGLCERGLEFGHARIHGASESDNAQFPPLAEPIET